MAAYSYKINHTGDKSTIVFHTNSHGEVTLVFKYKGMPDGNNYLWYDCFNLAIGKEIQAVSEEEELAHDISTIMYLFESFEHYPGSNQDFFFNVFDIYMSNHIHQFGRIVDTDLCSTIAYLGIVLNALAQNEPNGKTITQEGRMNLLDMLMARTEQKFGDYLYLTKYHRTLRGLQPYLVSFNEFKNNL